MNKTCTTTGPASLWDEGYQATRTSNENGGKESHDTMIPASMEPGHNSLLQHSSSGNVKHIHQAKRLQDACIFLMEQGIGSNMMDFGNFSFFQREKHIAGNIQVSMYDVIFSLFHLCAHHRWCLELVYIADPIQRAKYKPRDLPWTEAEFFMEKVALNLFKPLLVKKVVAAKQLEAYFGGFVQGSSEKQDSRPPNLLKGIQRAYMLQKACSTLNFPVSYIEGRWVMKCCYVTKWCYFEKQEMA